MELLRENIILVWKGGTGEGKVIYIYIYICIIYIWELVYLYDATCINCMHHF